jgi:hypothetical protein
LRKLKSTLVVLLLGLTITVVVGALLLTLFLPVLFQRFACAPYGIRCAVGQATIRAHLNLTADLVIDHLTLFNPDGRGTALRVKRLTATLNIPALILTRQVMPTEVRIENPELLLRQLDDGRWNLLALAQEVRQHLQPATPPTTLQFPRTALTADALAIGGHRVTDVNVTLEPKPAPVLFEMQARAAVDGRSVRVSGALRNTLEGQIQAQVQEDRLRGAARFRLDHPDRAVTISDWSFEAEGALARGKAAVRYTDWPPAYTLTITQWQADLGALAHRFPLPWLVGLTGIMEGESTTLQGRWPNLPVGQVAATFKDGGLALPAQQLKIIEVTGSASLQHTESGLRLQTGLRGKAFELLGQRYSNPSLHAALSVNPTTGNVIAEELLASISGAQIRAKGSGRRWGRDSLDLTTTELRIEPLLLTQLSHLADRGVSITKLVDPSIHVRWPGAGRPWKAEIMSRSTQLHAATMDVAATLQNVQIAIQGIGISWHRLEGALAIGQIDLAGRQLRALRARLQMDPDQVRIAELHVVAGNGDIQGHASLSRAASLQEMRLALSVRGLRPQSLFASTDQPAEAHGVTLDAELSADAAFGGSQLPTGSGRVTLRGLSLSLARNSAEPTPLVMSLQGSIPFALDKGLLTIPETALQDDGGLTLILTGSLPFGGRDNNAPRAHLSVPWTEVSTLRSTLAALMGGRPDATHLTGQFRADLELSGANYHGALALRNVGIGSNFFRLDGATGVIPLRGRIGQGATASADRASPPEQIGRRRLSEQAYQAAVEQFSTAAAKTSASLTIGALRYDPIALRNIELTLASSESRIAVQRLTFDAWGGRWSGWGTVEPLGGGIALSLLTEGLSLRAICDAFPPITGYISGRINGMADLRIPRLALDQARGNARFWAVDSPHEKRAISRTLIEQLAGQRIRYFSLFGADRRYDRGVLDVALQAGDLSFHELEISHTTLGFKDLDVRVSPTFNQIGLAHLLESISEAIERIRASAKPNH